jgi:DNA polymerase alpha subunit A
MGHLNIIPLTKQLTTIAGNLWFRSLQNARAERNEMLLLHEFSAKKFLCPDKKVMNSKDARKALFGDE